MGSKNRSARPRRPSREGRVKRNGYVHLAGGTKRVNRELEAKTRALAGWKGYTTNLVDQPAEFVIGAYHRLRHIVNSLRMSKHDLKA